MDRGREKLAVQAQDQWQSQAAAGIRDHGCMKLLGNQRSRSALAADSTTKRHDGSPVSVRLRHDPMAADARACCCPADPVVQVIIPWAEGRAGETDLLICAHHLRTSMVALRRLGAVVYDRRGDLLDDVAAVFARDR